MSFTDIDKIIDIKLDTLYSEINKNKIYEKILKDANFVRFQIEILSFLEDFQKRNPSKLTEKLEKNKNIIENNIQVIIYYYFFIGLIYFYKGGRDSFITNIIEISKNQSKSKIKIPGFFNSNTNGIIIKSYDIVKNSLELINQNTIEKIKTTITNAPIKYETTNNFIKSISLDVFKNKIVDNKDNFHILIKTIVIKNIYQEFERNNIISILNQERESEGEFRYITIVTAKVGKMVDYNVIQKMLTPEQLREGLADDIYNYILDYKEKNKIYLKNRENIVDYLFTEKILVPITEEFLRFHKKSEKYQKSEKTNKDETKAKFIISKLKQIKNYYSDVVQQDAKKNIDVKNLFYTPMINRLATLINQTEDVKIKNKLSQADTPELQEILNDMENLTKYSYLNFNQFSKDGIKIRPTKPVKSIRFTNLDKNNNLNFLETRMGNDLNELNVVGVMFLPEKDLPEFINKKELIEVDKDSPYKDFLNKTEKELLGKSSNKKYFWLFDTKKDKLESDLYQDVSGTDIDKTINIFLEDFYDKYYNIILEKTKKIILENKINSFEEFYNLLDIISKKYTDISREPEIYNNLVKYFRQKIIKNIPVTPDIIDNQIPNQNENLIKLPIVKSPIKPKNIILVDENINKKIKDVIDVKSICIHHLIWKNISSMRKNEIDDFNQKIFDFVKKYVKINESGEYICKSCDEIIPIQKYVYAGTYIEELDTFLTTSIAVSQNLERIPKYRGFNRTIKNLDRLVERIGLLSNFNILLGNTPIIKLRRKLIVKDTIDMVITNTDMLSKIMKSRNQAEARSNSFKQKYNIDPTYSKIFFFQLKDDIFLTSSEDTDKYKIIKYNNLIIYLMLMIMLEINSGQILGIKETKFYNFYFFEKFMPLFSKLKLRFSEKDIIAIDKIPLFAYTIYIISGMISKDGIWFGTEKTSGVNIEAQKEIIFSFIDLINTIIEFSFKKDKPFIYDIFTNKILNQIKGTYQDLRVFNMIKAEKRNNMIINKDTKKLQFIERKHKGIIIRDNKTIDTDLIDIKISDKDFDKCYTQHKILNNKKIINYSELTTSELYYNKLNQQLKILLEKMCSREKLETWEKTLCDKYSPNFDKDIEKKDIDFFLQNIKNIQTQKFIKSKLEEDKIINKFKSKLLRREQVINRWEIIYKKEKGFETFLDSFLNKIRKNIGEKIQTENINLYINNQLYIINNDYLGNQRKNILYILESEGIFKEEIFNDFFKNPVRYFFDNKSRTYMYYHLITNQYLGYSIDKKRFQKLTPNNYLQINHGLKFMIENLGNNYKYERILDYFNTKPKDKNLIVKTIFNNRINNLKNIIFKANSILHQIKFKNNKNNEPIVKEFIQRISNFNINNIEGKSSVFKNINHIHNIKANEITGEFIFEFEDYFDTTIFKKLNNNDNKLIFYLIYELNKLIEYNDNKKIQTELSYFIISLIKFLFDLYYKNNFSIEVQKFYFLSKIIDDDTMVDERVSFVGMYSELLRQEDLENEEILDKKYDDEQEVEALDVDDVESDDDFVFDNEYEREIPDNLI